MTERELKHPSVPSVSSYINILKYFKHFFILPTLFVQMKQCISRKNATVSEVTNFKLPLCCPQKNHFGSHINLKLKVTVTCSFYPI
jgi:hypothetical protein